MQKDTAIYELGYILGNHVDPDSLNERAKTLEEFIAKHGGIVIERSLPKKRKLSYKIKGDLFGYFGTVIFSSASGTTIGGLEKELDLFNDIVRFIVMRQAEKAPVRRKKVREIIQRHQDEKPVQPATETYQPSHAPEEKEKAPATSPASDTSSRVKLEDLDKKLEEILGEN